MAILVCGASSQLGYFLLPRLIAAGEPVLALSRRDQPAQADVLWLRGALPDAVPDVPALSAVVSLGPLRAFADWVARTPIGQTARIIAISSMSAESKRDSVVAAERAISQQLRDGEAALADACARHGHVWTVLRPTLVYGAGLDRSLSPIARRASRTRIFPLPEARGLRQPVHADDVAQAVLAALDCPAAAGQVLPIGGGERLTAAVMFARVRQSLPTATLPLPLPSWLLRSCRQWLPRLRGPLTRLDCDLVADNNALEKLLGIHPRGFAPDAAMWTHARQSA